MNEKDNAVQPFAPDPVLTRITFNWLIRSLSTYYTLTELAIMDEDKYKDLVNRMEESVMPRTKSNAAFLRWIYERLVHIHGENALYDYMHRLREVIEDVSRYEEEEERNGTNPQANSCPHL